MVDKCRQVVHGIRKMCRDEAESILHLVAERHSLSSLSGGSREPLPFLPESSPACISRQAGRQSPLFLPESQAGVQVNHL